MPSGWFAAFERADEYVPTEREFALGAAEVMCEKPRYMDTVRAVGTEPFGKHPRFAGSRGTLAYQRFDFENRHCERITRLSPFDEDGPRLRIAFGLCGFVTAVRVGSNLAAERIFGFNQDFIAGCDPHARSFVT